MSQCEHDPITHEEHYMMPKTRIVIFHFVGLMLINDNPNVNPNRKTYP